MIVSKPVIKGLEPVVLNCFDEGAKSRHTILLESRI